MRRRSFLQLVVGLPFLGFLKPATAVSPLSKMDIDKIVAFFDTYPENIWVRTGIDLYSCKECEKLRRLQKLLIEDMLKIQDRMVYEIIKT